MLECSSVLVHAFNIITKSLALLPKTGPTLLAGWVSYYQRLALESSLCKQCNLTVIQPLKGNNFPIHQGHNELYSMDMKAEAETPSDMPYSHSKEKGDHETTESNLTGCQFSSSAGMIVGNDPKIVHSHNKLFDGFQFSISHGSNIICIWLNYDGIQYGLMAPFFDEP
eukprot:Gb_19695 [translate_table: standard]